MNVIEITCDELSRIDESGYIPVDIRGRTAFENRHIPNAVLWEDVFDCLPENKTIVLYCAVGKRSREFAEKLAEKGFNAKSLAGGYRQWLTRGFDGLSDYELMRYDRQIILPEIGSKGQRKLKNSLALIVGAGGLGSPAALNLAGSGELLSGKLRTINGLSKQARTINIRHKNPNCLACNISKDELRRRIAELPVPAACK